MAAADKDPAEEKLKGFEFWCHSLNSAQLVVAPMVDQSELAWRLLSRRHGAQLCYTPMYHASVFVRDANYRREALLSTPEDRPLIVQFCANKPDIFLKAAQYAAPHCEAVDLNLGCPQSIAKRGHYGAFLQDEWELLKEMVSTCHKHLSVPITCKVRIYKDIDKTVQYAQMLEKAGCQLLTVHGRTKEQKGVDTGIACWEHIKAVREAVSIPVFANGNIQYLEDVHRCIAETGVQGVMSAEGNLHNPALFSGKDVVTWDIATEYLEIYKLHPCPLSYIRGHMFKLFHHPLQEHLDLRDVLGKAKLVPEFERFIAVLKERCQPDVDKYAAEPSSLKSKLPLPYWLCQPYVRPGPDEDEEEKQKRKEKRQESKKRPLEVSKDGDLSINKMKRLVRNPDKDFKPKHNKPVYIKCLTCGNPKGMKCDQNMCKSCCRDKSRKDLLNCEGHRLWFKNWHEKKLQAEAETLGTAETSQSDENTAQAQLGQGTEKDLVSKEKDLVTNNTGEKPVTHNLANIGTDNLPVMDKLEKNVGDNQPIRDRLTNGDGVEPEAKQTSQSSEIGGNNSKVVVGDVTVKSVSDADKECETS